VIDVEITGVTMTDLVRMIPDGRKGTPAFTYDLIDPNGEVISGGSSISEDLGAEHLHLVGFRLNHGGNYTLRFTYVGSGEFERVLHVP
jgi:hypothetical protein